MGGRTLKDVRSVGLKTITNFNSSTNTWSNIGSLITARQGHNVIYDGSNLIVVGGERQVKTEVCRLLNDKMFCVEQTPELFGYANYPELFLVSDNFCQ